MSSAPSPQPSALAWQPVIGLEIHAQLSTASKLFSGASTAYGAEPNTHASVVDVAMPGTLPVPNHAALDKAIRFGLAVNGQIARHSVFARKNYFYPDLPKGYQISQYELPIVANGRLRVQMDDGRVLDVEIQRAHLEEDAGKSLHDAFHAATAIDLNRSGTPLLEIVSAPVLHSAAEAVAYMRTVHTLVRWLGICDGNMQEGSFRCDANVSVRPAGESKLGTRTEIKNVNSFRFVEKAIDYEIERQIRLIESGGSVVQETRLYDPERSETRSMRTKEDAQDYRYFPDPDLPPLVLEQSWIDEQRATLPELPEAKRARFASAHGLPAYHAATLTLEQPVADFFEETVRAGAEPKAAADWILETVLTVYNEGGTFPVTPDRLAALIGLVKTGTVSKQAAKTVYGELLTTSDAPADIANRLGLVQVSDSGQLGKWVDEVLAAHPGEVARFKGGEAKLIGFLVGQVMKKSQGKADPKGVQPVLLKALAGEQ